MDYEVEAHKVQDFQSRRKHQSSVIECLMVSFLTSYCVKGPACQDWPTVKGLLGYHQSDGFLTNQGNPTILIFQS
ncbi:hypothetical protein HanIR_Chr01g0037681 [Helianthus annuus]|nr:hypothetical protein HanIR_Chr01g0037681 [Helianthus annuus]